MGVSQCVCINTVFPSSVCVVLDVKLCVCVCVCVCVCGAAASRSRTTGLGLCCYSGNELPGASAFLMKSSL